MDESSSAPDDDLDDVASADRTVLHGSAADWPSHVHRGVGTTGDAHGATADRSPERAHGAGPEHRVQLRTRPARYASRSGAAQPEPQTQARRSAATARTHRA